MNYAEWELERQRQVLRRLLEGTRPEETEEREQGRTETRTSASAGGRTWADRGTAGRPGWRRGAAAGIKTRTGWEEVLWNGGGTGAFQETGLAESGETGGEEPPISPDRVPGWDEASAVAPRQWGQRVPEERTGGGAKGSGALSPALPLAMWREEPVPGDGKDTEARALSLVFQRDARRYDGGFTLY